MREEYVKAFLIFIGALFLLAFALSPFIWMLWISFTKSADFIVEDYSQYVVKDDASAEQVLEANYILRLVGYADITEAELNNKIGVIEKEEFEKKLKEVKGEDKNFIQNVYEYDSITKQYKLKTNLSEKELYKVDFVLAKAEIGHIPTIMTKGEFRGTVNKLDDEADKVFLGVMYVLNDEDNKYYLDEDASSKEINRIGAIFAIMKTNAPKIIKTEDYNNLLDKQIKNKSYIEHIKNTYTKYNLFTFQNYINVLTSESLRFTYYFRNSIVIATITSIVVTLVASLSGYAVSRMRFPGRIVVPLIVLAMSMFPQISIVGYLYTLFSNLGLRNTYIALILPYIAWNVPIALWINMSYFTQIPLDLDKAALVDGASRVKTLFKVVLPIALPGIFSSFLLIFISCFNEFLFALMLTSTYKAQTLPVGIAFFQGLHGELPWGNLMAASALAAVPLVILTLIFQRYIVSGLAGGAVKG